jgi:hypothetical protein
MAFTVAELENISNALIDFHMDRGKVKSQSIQDKPLLAAMRENAKEFPNGKELITVRVKGQYTTTIQGFEHDDTVTYANPANIRTASYPWKLIHSGINFTMHELAKAGISIRDTADGSGESQHSNSEKQILANLLEDKIEDMQEGTNRGFQTMYWRDGTQDAKLIPGITSFILNDPTSATVVGGIDQSANTWWRNRASLGISATSGTASDQNLVQTLQGEFRQLRRYGGKPNLILAGSDFMTQFERELRAKGNYTLEGWSGKGAIDASVADLKFKGITVQYDPTLDDLSKAKYGYVLDTSTIFPMVMSGEDMKKHSPARPENKYVFYRAMTTIAGLVCNQRNANGVYSIA